MLYLWPLAQWGTWRSLQRNCSVNFCEWMIKVTKHPSRSLAGAWHEILLTKGVCYFCFSSNSLFCQNLFGLLQVPSELGLSGVSVWSRCNVQPYGRVPSHKHTRLEAFLAVWQTSRKVEKGNWFSIWEETHSPFFSCWVWRGFRFHLLVGAELGLAKQWLWLNIHIALC